MKNLLTTVFLVTASFTVGAHSVFALSALDIGGSAYNPLYIQIEQDPFQQRMQQDSQIRYQNTQQENNLKSTYGLSNFYSCSSDRSSQDLSDPHSMTQYLNTVKYCLELKSINGSNTRQSTFLRDQQAKQSGTLCNGQYWNACSGGKNFVCPSAGDAYCEVPKTNDQMCREGYGVNSNWDGVTKYKDGAPVCGCKDGYSWNDQRTSCIVVPVPPKVVETPKVKTTVQAQVITPASHTKEASVDGALPDTQTVKSKSLWATIRGWFGF